MSNREYIPDPAEDSARSLRRVADALENLVEAVRASALASVDSERVLHLATWCPTCLSDRESADHPAQD